MKAEESNKKTLKDSLKSEDTEEVIDIYFYRPIGYFFAKIAMKLHITPNMITIASIFIGTILEFYVLDKHLGNKLSYIFVLNLGLSALLWMIVRRLRCPVCKNVFVGKESPELFTHKCRHCGRRSGDTH